MDEKIQHLITQYQNLYHMVYEDRKIGESAFKSSDLEYLDTIEMMIGDLKKLKDED